MIDPELGGNIVDLGMTTRTCRLRGDVRIGVKLTIAGCRSRAQIKKDVETRVAAHPGVHDVTIEWGEMTADERSEVMLKRAGRREGAPDTQIPATTRVLAIASGKGGVGKSSVTVNLAAAHLGRRLHRRRPGCRHLGVLGPAHARTGRPARGQGRRGAGPLILPYERAVVPGR